MPDRIQLRRTKGWRMPEGAICPTPNKQRHDTEQAAWCHAESLRRGRDASVDLKPYRCACNAWHVGHSQASLTRRIRLARRRGTA